MALKGIKPTEVRTAKPKFMLSGKSGTGKSFFALNWPAPFYIDTEKGVTRKQYIDKLIKAGGVYMGPDEGSQDFKEVTNQLRELATTQHGHKTIVIDSFSKLYNTEIDMAEARGVSSDFGKSKREAKLPSVELMNWFMRADMCGLLICHQRDKWERREKELILADSIYDGYPKMDYDLDLWLETKLAGKVRYGTVRKSRIDAFPMLTDIDLDFDTFKKLYGASVIESPVAPIVLADPKQIGEIVRIVELLQVPPEDQDKWLNKAQASKWDDLSKDQAAKLLEFLNKKLKGEVK